MSFNYKDQDKAKAAFMDGYSYPQIAKLIGCSQGTIATWSKKGGWRKERDGAEHPNAGQVEGHKFVRGETEFEAAAEPPPGVRDFDDLPDPDRDYDLEETQRTELDKGADAVIKTARNITDDEIRESIIEAREHEKRYQHIANELDGITDPAPEVEPDAPVAPAVDELRAEVAALQKKNADLTREVVKTSKVVDISLFLSDPVAWTDRTNPEGVKYWTNRAEAKFAADNMDRAKQGLPQFNINDHPEILDDLVEELKEEMRQRGDRPLGVPGEFPKIPRRIKMIIDRNGTPTIEQLPLEGQVNNMAGSMADGIMIYTVKGFKMTSPILCTRQDCYKPAALNPQGSLVHKNAYCTALHEKDVEGSSDAFIQEHTGADSMLERMANV